MTLPPDEHGDLLRRALRAEADAVVPSPDGLEIIRARIERRGVRNLFWWRAGAAAASAVLVAGTIVLAVPELRSKVINESPITVVDQETTGRVPSNSSTTRSQQPPPPPASQDDPVVVVPAEPTSPTPSKPPRTAGSTSRPSPTPSAEATACPSVDTTPDDCPAASPSPAPTEADPTVQPSTCPTDQCPADAISESPADIATPLLETGGATTTP
ncbi:hypothetical protein Nocox_10725 [Nonomuraea coxensis DSM 45129]|uniref:Uncharacterized protein n=1 Tax=Nonomuraea coxensis DSM 45129 TaxID=1122611 RepID=A0ABX8TZ08_9ACTN|nr:hypothetical protein [Nonomuraea coxensis]QYC39764.1 hypothetical protein Nocox_10725 [Nonomuraea coxensis DSM 45129]